MPRISKRLSGYRRLIQTAKKSISVTLPREELRVLGWEIGDTVYVENLGKILIIKFVSKKGGEK